MAIEDFITYREIKSNEKLSLDVTVTALPLCKLTYVYKEEKMATVKEAEALDAKELQGRIDNLESILTHFERRVAEIRTELSPYYHARNLRTGTAIEKAKWDMELDR